MTIPRVEVITSVERRRRWSREEKEQLVAASFEPGVTASEVARAAGIHASQLFRWRKQLCERVEPAPTPQLLPVEIAPQQPAAPIAPEEPAAAPARRRRKSGIIEIELGGGRRVRVDRDVDTEVLRRVLDLLGPR
jgi:transposase